MKETHVPQQTFIKSVVESDGCLMLTSARLQIIPLTLPLLRKLLCSTAAMENALGLAHSGLELDAHTHDAMAYLAELAEKTPNSYPWITNWQIIDDERALSVGSACFMNVPDEKGCVEIGYGIHAPFQKRGYMTEALDVMCEWAFQHEGITAIRAESEPDNAASHRVLAKCGFLPCGENFFIRQKLL